MAKGETRVRHLTNCGSTRKKTIDKNVHIFQKVWFFATLRCQTTFIVQTKLEQLTHFYFIQNDTWIIFNKGISQSWDTKKNKKWNVGVFKVRDLLSVSTYTQKWGGKLHALVYKYHPDKQEQDSYWQTTFWGPLESIQISKVRTKADFTIPPRIMSTLSPEN